ncbi:MULTISPECIES: lipoprotein [unclassified Erwinia]|uniref:lipoprotein n=1 Tax=unclassified Erwinia TaxID=2622719 RepID=UPI00130472FC|nr:MULTISPECIES: lipoprotein [unclassified Erwinia]
MKKIVMLAVMLTLVSGCSVFSPGADPEPNQAARATDSKAQPCNSSDSHCAKPVTPSFH